MIELIERHPSAALGIVMLVIMISSEALIEIIANAWGF